jgi:hypothetical protein
VLWLLILVSAALFSIRGVGRINASGLADFAAPYAGAKVLIQGGNPYDSAQLSQSLLAAAAQNGEHTMAVYPPGSLGVMFIFAPFSAGFAQFAMIMVGIGLIGCGAVGWMRLLSFSPVRMVVAAGLILACSPLHTAMTVSNPVLLAAGALLAGSALVESGVRRWGFFLIGMALTLKPQVGLTGVLWLLMGARIRPAILVGGAAAVWHVSIAAALFARQPAAWFSWMANLYAETTSGSISAEAYLGFQRIDPAGVWFAVTGLALPVAATLGLAIGFVFLSMRAGARDETDSPHTQIIRLGSAGVALLLAGYHRSYDALLLVPVWLAVIGCDLRLSDRMSVWLGVLTLGWILPGAGFWRLVPGLFGLPDDSFDSSMWWTAGMLRLHGWLLLMTALSVCFLKLRPALTDRSRLPSA